MEVAVWVAVGLNLNPRTDLVLVGVGMRKVPSELG